MVLRSPLLGRQENQKGQNNICALTQRKLNSRLAKSRRSCAASQQITLHTLHQLPACFTILSHRYCHPKIHKSQVDPLHLRTICTCTSVRMVCWYSLPLLACTVKTSILLVLCKNSNNMRVHRQVDEHYRSFGPDIYSE